MGGEFVYKDRKRSRQKDTEKKTQKERMPPILKNKIASVTDCIEFQEVNGHRIYNLSNEESTPTLIGKSEATQAATFRSIKFLGSSRWVKLFRKRCVWL